MIKTIGEFKKSLLDNIKKSSKNADDFACEVINKYCSDMVYYPIHSRGDINKMIEVEVVERNRIRIAQHDMVAEGMSRYYGLDVINPGITLEKKDIHAIYTDNKTRERIEGEYMHDQVILSAKLRRKYDVNEIYLGKVLKTRICEGKGTAETFFKRDGKFFASGLPQGETFIDLLHGIKLIARDAAERIYMSKEYKDISKDEQSKPLNEVHNLYSELQKYFLTK